ncbi:AAA family ATPase [Micromonospora sp. NPDC048170]|uniref:ATP-dependent nuclease n=1 Tax=Micromonospora sp. NPDC048170 TaxID=3154819 RepID=UPI003401A5F5
MRFRNLRIENFRGIRRLVLDDLKELVLIAGPNGCGKSAALDAIRLLKSFYGGYQANEWHQWMGEFQIDISKPHGLRKLFGNPSEALLIEAEIELSDEEIQHLRNNAESVITPIIWGRILGRSHAGGIISANEANQYGSQVADQVAKKALELRQALVGSTFKAGFRLPPQGQLQVDQSIPLTVAFQTYAPQVIGVIDYHSSSRTYEREAIGGVNLNLEALTEQRKGYLLYNWREKYRNVKTELASHYVREVIAQRAGVGRVSDLNQTLNELFQKFFPDKTYEGPTPQSDGSLNFPVRLSNGQVHDIDDLSSGEKEVLYGYLRLRNSAPRNSVILIDEPELHLNPRLLQGFSDFYHMHLGRALNNQLWLVTHSDSLLRQAVGNPNFSVYHMSPVTTTVVGENQAAPVVATDDVERAVVAMVGDLAAYRPRAKVVIFEGGGDSDTDVLIVSRLFPSIAQRMNLVSGGHKRRVRDLYSTLAETASRAGLSERFYAVVDRDRGLPEPPEGTNILSWDRYHIENYLLSEPPIRAALASTLGRDPFTADEEVAIALRDCASSIMNRLVLERIQQDVNDGLVSAIRVNASPRTAQPAVDLKPSIVGSLARLRDLGETFSSDDWLNESEGRHRATLESALESDAWMVEFPGRSILSLFVERHVPGASYPVFRNVVLDKMVEMGAEPAGLKLVLDQIDAA